MTIKTVQNLEQNPYRTLHLVREEETVVNEENSRKYYTIYHYQKTYNYHERLSHLIGCFRKIFSSPYKTWRKLGKACWGSTLKRVKCLTPHMEVVTLPRASSQPRNFTSVQLATLQGDLNQRKIQLNCQNPPQLTQRNHSHPENIQAYLRTLPPEEEALKTRLFQQVDKITFEELQAGIASCSQKLQQFLSNHPYLIGFVPQKSSQWVAELALPYLASAPVGSFVHATDNLAAAGQSILTSPEKNFVIFDDAAYSGNQLGSIITRLREALRQGEEGHLYLVVPFISATALQLLERSTVFSPSPQQSSERFYGHLHIHLITTDRKVKSLRDAFSDPEIVRLLVIDGQGDYCVGRTPKCLTFTEWKVPDDTSIPPNVKYELVWTPHGREHGTPFITAYPPPYKS